MPATTVPVLRLVLAGAASVALSACAALFPLVEDLGDGRYRVEVETHAANMSALERAESLAASHCAGMGQRVSYARSNNNTLSLGEATLDKTELTFRCR